MNRFNYITVTEFAEFNPELDLSGYTSATISGMIQRASAQTDNFLQYSLVTQAITGEKSEAVVNSVGNLVIYTRKQPIQSVQAISLNVGASAVSLTLDNGNGSNLQIPSRGTSIIFPYIPFAWTGTFMLNSFFSLRDWDFYVTVDYTAGYDLNDIPPDIKDAVNLIAKDIFIRQANPQNMSLMQQGGIRMQFNAPPTDGKSAYVKQAEGILSSYKRFIGV